MGRNTALIGLAAVLACICAAVAWAAHYWILLSVDDPGTADVGKQSSVVLDASDYPYISYADATNGDLKYAYWDGSQWVIEVADDVAVVRTDADTSIDLDASGRAHISYYSGTPDWNLQYARRDGPGSWFRQTVASAGNVGRYNSLALDSSGQPCIAYSDETNHYLRYCKRTGATWTFDTPDDSGYVGGPCSLGLRSNGWPEIAYYYNDGFTRGIEYVRWAGLFWDWRPSIPNGAWPRLYIDSAGTAHIGYQNSTDRSLKYAVWNGTSWSTETVDPAADLYAAPGIGVGSDGVPQIAYCSGSMGNLKLAVRVGPGNWDIETGDSSGQVWPNLSLAVGSANDPQISYYRSDAQALWCAVTQGPLAVRWPRD